jgi:Zn-dependent protease
MRFSLFKMPVVVRPMFWFVAVLLGMPSSTSGNDLAETGIFVVLLFVSILVHELGHAFAMRAFGRQPSIELWGLGGLTHWGPGAEVSAARHIVVSLAGPGAGFVLGGIVLLASARAPLPPHSLAAQAVRQALWINIGWGVVNLFPLLPLDGGHALEWTLDLFFGKTGRRVAQGLSLLLGVAAVAVALYYRSYWLAFLAFWCASISYRALKARPSSATPATLSPAESALREVWSLLMAGNTEAAGKACEALLAALPDGAAERDAVLELLAWSRIESGDEPGALDVARRIREKPSDLLSARLEIARGNLAEGLARLERAFYEGGDAFAALVLSSVYVDHDRPDLALEILKSRKGKTLSSSAHLAISSQLFYAARYELALAASELGWKRFHESRHAYNAACSLAKLHRVDEGIDQLAAAASAGLEDLGALDSDPDLAPLRSHPRFQEIRSRAASR